MAAITSPQLPAAAVQIASGAEGVLFCSTTLGTNTSIDSCCQFSNANNRNPTSSLFGSPAMIAAAPSHGWRSFADAPAAGPVAAGLGPVLLNRADWVPAEVLDEIRRLEPAEIVVVGGTNALGTRVLTLTPCG